MSLFLHVLRSLGACIGLFLVVLVAIGLLVMAIQGSKEKEKEICGGFIILLLIWLSLSLLYIIPYLTRIIAGG